MILYRPFANLHKLSVNDQFPVKKKQACLSKSLFFGNTYLSGIASVSSRNEFTYGSYSRTHGTAWAHSFRRVLYSDEASKCFTLVSNNNIFYIWTNMKQDKPCKFIIHRPDIRLLLLQSNAVLYYQHHLPDYQLISIRRSMNIIQYLKKEMLRYCRFAIKRPFNYLSRGNLIFKDKCNLRIASTIHLFFTSSHCWCIIPETLLLFTPYFLICDFKKDWYQ